MDANNPMTPGIYTVEKNAFPNAVPEVPTSISVFVGYTEMAIMNGKPIMAPLLINSMADYHRHFGGAPVNKYPIVEVSEASENTFSIAGKNYQVKAPGPGNLFYLYHCLQLFFQNGGGSCYIASIGDYQTSPIAKEHFTSQLDKMTQIPFPKPAIILAPDSLLLSEEDYYEIQKQFLAHCGELQDRVALIDVYQGDRKGVDSGVISTFRNSIGNEHLKYGISYYPFLETTILELSDWGYFNIDSTSDYAQQLSAVSLDQLFPNEPLLNDIKKCLDAATELDAKTLTTIKQYDQALQNKSADYKKLLSAVLKQACTLPPGPAMAGVFTLVDNSEGVWIAPANRNIDSVVAPTSSIDNDQQAGLNVDAMEGKSINAIRSFYGRGPAIIWGARTLDGNSNDWRYINVVRTMIMIEQSIKNAAFSMVFHLNDAYTWNNLEGMISNFLHNLWSAGALMGATSDAAFKVAIGLGKTMTPQDILNGIMRVEVKVALVHPAEYIIITYEQEMAKS